MTSASELLYNRRSRQNRTADDANWLNDLRSSGINYSIDRNLSSRHRPDLDGCDLPRRSPHLRRHRPSQSQLERTTYSPDNHTDMESPRNIRRPGWCSDTLPGSVLRARQRLVERLGGQSLSPNRQSSRDLLRMARLEYDLDDHWRLIEARGWSTEVSTQSSTRRSHVTNSHRTASANREKPPGLSQDAVDSLCSEVFNCRSGKNKAGDCSICLESFTEGDKLLCLPCTHRFHSTCLNPWIRTCGDCPYCRQTIIIHSNC